MALGKTYAQTSLAPIDLPNMSIGAMSNGAHSRRVWMVGAGNRYPVMSAVWRPDLLVSRRTDLAKHRNFQNPSLDRSGPNASNPAVR
jgi:hypothetical protein